MTVNILGIRICIKKEAAAAVIISLCVLLGLVGYLMTRNDNRIVIQAPNPEEEADSRDIASPQTTGDKTGDDTAAGENQAVEIKVYVTGCVNSPGIVTLKSGQLVDDAIAAAGGVTQEADMNSINLVYKLDENVMLYIKSKEDAEKTQNAGEAGNGIDIIRDSGGVVLYGNSQAAGQGGRININKADEKELDTLPGIGQSTAAAIIEFRKKNGPFKAIKDIMKIPGIKESRFNSIKDYITVE